MKTNHLPQFWIAGTVDTMTSGGNKVVLKVHRVYGENSNARFGDMFKGTFVTFDRHPDPEFNSIKIASSIEVDETGLDYEIGNEDAGHRFVKDLQISAKVEFDKSKEMNDAGGLRIIAWNLRQVYEAAKAKIDANLTADRRAKEQEEQEAERMKHQLFKVFLSGGTIDPNKDGIATESLYDLCRWFEFIAWPPGIVFAVLVNRRKWEIVKTPRMLKKPGFDLGRPKWNNHELERLHKIVKDRDSKSAPVAKAVVTSNYPGQTPKGDAESEDQALEKLFEKAGA